jgi:cytochrome c-type biogenesis protein CcmE
MSDFTDTPVVDGTPESIDGGVSKSALESESSTLPRTRRTRQKRRLIVVFAVLIAAIVFLLVEGLGSSLNYFDTVSQALAHKSSLGTSSVRLEGVVVPGSVKSTAVGTNFSISEGHSSIPIHNTGSPPQLFQPNIPVVVVGHFASATSTTFESNQILVKHSANYIAEHPTRVTAPNGSKR